MSPAELTLYIGIVVAIPGAYAVLKKLRPEKDSLVITQAQGAAKILDDLVQTLYRETDRLRAELRSSKEENVELRRELERLRRERRKG